MNNFKYFCQKHKASILISFGFALSVGIAGYATFSKMALEKQFQQQASETKETHEKILAMSNTIGDLQLKKIESDKEIIRLQSAIDASKSEIAAFAKQAASCDRIKKRLHIKE